MCRHLLQFGSDREQIAKRFSQTIHGLFHVVDRFARPNFRSTCKIWVFAAINIGNNLINKGNSMLKLILVLAAIIYWRYDLEKQRKKAYLLGGLNNGIDLDVLNGQIASGKHKGNTELPVETTDNSL